MYMHTSIKFFMAKKSFFLLECCQFILVFEVLDVVFVQGVGALDLLIALVTDDVAVTVELELEKFGEGVQKRCLGHQCVWGALQNRKLQSSYMYHNITVETLEGKNFCGLVGGK